VSFGCGIEWCDVDGGSSKLSGGSAQRVDPFRRSPKFKGASLL
jgi:hypothetical protein